MKYSPNGLSKTLLLVTNRLEIIPTVEKFCHLFHSLRIELEHDEGFGEKLAHSVNTHCPANVRIKFVSDGRDLRTSYTYEHVTEVLIRFPEYSRNFQLHQMFPSVEKLTLFLSNTFRLGGPLPNLTDVEINEHYAKLVDLRALTVNALQIRNLKIDLWWEPEHLEQIDRLFNQLESLHISFQSETAPEAPLGSTIFGLLRPRPQKPANQTIHFRNVKHFTVEFIYFERKPIAGCLEKLATITFDRLESMKYISMDIIDPDKQIDLVTRNKDLTNVVFGAFTLPYSLLTRLLIELPKLRHLTLFSTDEINNIMIIMGGMKTNLETITAVGNDAMRDAFLEETIHQTLWTLENDGFFEMPNIRTKSRSLTYKRRGAQ